MANNKDILNIEILDEIGGWGFGFQDLYKKAKGFKGSKIRIPINSFGGSVLEGLLIYNFLKGSGKEIETHIPTYAMSMGTVIASAGDHVSMSENGYYMIHNPWGLAIGDSSEMQSNAELLAKMENDLVSIYVAKTGLPEQEIRDMMSAETWLTSEEALEKGFVDELTKGAKIQAKYDPKAFESFQNIPEDLGSLFETPKAEKTTPETNSFLKELKALLPWANTEKTFSEELHILKSDHTAALQLQEDTNKLLKEQWQADEKALNDEITALKAEVERLKKLPIEASTEFETSPANVGENDKFLTSWDIKLRAEQTKKA